MSNECSHFDEDLLERYSLGHSTGPECAAFEEHILLCEACQQRLRETDTFIATARAAMARWIRRKPSRAAIAAALVAVAICCH